MEFVYSVAGEVVHMNDNLLPNCKYFYKTKYITYVKHDPNI